MKIRNGPKAKTKNLWILQIYRRQRKMFFESLLKLQRVSKGIKKCAML